MIDKYNTFINEEVGIRNLTKTLKGKKKCEIYFHKDLDGVTSALSMKVFLDTYYQIKTVNCHVIQYGGLEYAIKSGIPDTLKILVDFAHGKPMFHIQSDHHDNQIGSEETETYFKPSRSNVEIISGEISYSDIFTSQDIKLIQTVDSANFLKNNINPEDVQNSIFSYKKAETPQKNRFMMGFVVNRLLLAYKNKRITVKSLNKKISHVNKNILECLVLDSTASLYSMFNNIRNYINNAKTSDRLGRLATPEEIKENLTKYINRMKDYGFVEGEGDEIYEIGRDELRVLNYSMNMDISQKEEVAKKLKMSNEDFNKYLDRILDKNYLYLNRYDKYLITGFGRKLLNAKKTIKGIYMDEEYKILIQYGGGNMMKPGSYDRYTPFKNFPDAEFICIVWPMGLIQVSCNPFKEKKIKNINLGEIAKEVLAKYKPLMSKYYISLESIKKEFETSQDWKQMQRAEGEEYKGVGFKYSDLKAFYEDSLFKKEDGKIINIDIEDDKIKESMNSSYKDLSEDQKTLLKNIKIPVWEIIIRNSGGHPSITNISGLNFLKYNSKMLKITYGVEKYTEVLKKIARDLVTSLKEKIDNINDGKKVEYDTKGVKLQATTENYEYQLVNKDGISEPVSKEEFVKAGSNKGMKTDRKSLMTIDNINKKIIAKFEKFKYLNENKTIESNIKKYILRCLFIDGPNSVGHVEGYVFNKLGYIDDKSTPHFYKLYKKMIEELSQNGNIEEYEERNTNFLKLKK